MRTIETSTLDVRPLGGRLGAEIRGIPVTEDLPRGVVELLKDALLEHKVLILRGQHLDGASHTRLLRRFGTPDAGADDVDDGRAGEVWFTPGSHRLAPPKVFSIRAGDDGEAVRIADVGGAYRDLPRPLRALADRTWALHSARGAATGEQVAHPVTRLHTETGERGLFIGANARQVLGLADAESRTVLDLLQSFVTRPHNVFAWTAQPGDVLVADARSIQVRFPTRQAGLVVRTVTGDAPLGINGQHSHHPAPAEPAAVRRSA